MAMLCIFGVCIPYSVIWPVIIYALKELYVFFFGATASAKEKKQVQKDAKNSEQATAGTENNAERKKNVGEALKKGFLGYLESEEDFEAIIEQDIPTFVKFTAKWCKPCQETEGVFKSIAEEKGDHAAFINVDVDQFDEIAAKNRAIALPLLICFHEGKAIERLTGKDPEAIKLFVDDYIKKLSK